jgi:hypothetical protein
MLRTYPDLEQRAVHPVTASPAHHLGILGAFWRSLAEGLVASREYERLRAWGVPDDAALRTAFGIDASRSRRGTQPVQPLCFAGRV